MSLIRTAYDIDSLALALVPMLKAQSRIDRDDEDAQAQEIIARCIGRIERQCGICIAPQEFAWNPRDTTRAIVRPWNYWREVEIPVRGFTDINGVDVDGGVLTYRLSGDVGQLRFGRAWIEREPSGMQGDDAWTIAAGYETPNDMPPELRDTLIRYAATLWENRESWAVSAVVHEVPEWVTEALGIFWVPEV